MDFTVLSPWADRKVVDPKPLNPRVSDLNGKTIGLLGLFKEYCPSFIRIVGNEIAKVYPEAKFSEFIYKIDQMDIEDDPINFPLFKEWLEGVDTVVGVGADAGSCSIYAGYVFATCEKLGVPTVLWTTDIYESAARCGLAAKGFPKLRQILYGAGFAMVPPGVDIDEYTEQEYGDLIRSHMQECIEAMTVPLTEEEKNPAPVKDSANITLSGTYDELNRMFYTNKWTNGTPIVPPTEEAIAEMCEAADLPRDHVVAYLPPMNGAATVEKIAVNGVMAGCLPVHMPILIAIVRALSDPKLIKPFTSCPTGFPMVNLECHTCSTAAFAPMFIISGSICKDINLDCGINYLSPYDLSKNCIPMTYSYMIMNIAGVRTKTEDMSPMGHECRFGVCIGENLDESPWPGLQVDFGYEAEDSAIVVNWFTERAGLRAMDGVDALQQMCDMRLGGMDAGVIFTLEPRIANSLANMGMSKQDVMDYILEYARRPADTIPRMIIGNNHEPKGFILPKPGNYWAKKYFSQDHMLISVGPKNANPAFLSDGGHGTPACAKIDLPKNWDAIVAKYKDVKPIGIKYY